MKTKQDIAIFLLRIALATGFLSAVASRLGLWGSQSSGWRNFVSYTAETNSFLPQSFAPGIALISTAAELLIGILLFGGYQVSKTALFASVLTLLFAIAMSISFGCKESLDYSVFVFSAGAFLLSTFPHYRWTLEEFLKSNNLKFNIMNTNIHDYIVKTEQTEWQPLIEKGIHYEGIFVKSLKFDPKKNRSTTILLKFEAGASYPYHNHPAGEELFVMEGDAIIAGVHLGKGDYLYTPPTFKHSVKSENGCILFFMIPEEVEIL